MAELALAGVHLSVQHDEQCGTREKPHRSGHDAAAELPAAVFGLPRSVSVGANQDDVAQQEPTDQPAEVGVLREGRAGQGGGIRGREQVSSRDRRRVQHRAGD